MEQKRKTLILSVLRDATTPLGSAEITRRARHRGTDMSPRTVRHYLTEMAREGLVTESGRGRGAGRRITARGRAEVRDALVQHRIGLTAARIDTLACDVTFDLAARIGRVVVSVSIVDTDDAPRAVERMRPVLEAGLGMGHFVGTLAAGHAIGDLRVPTGKLAIATVSDVTLSGVFLSARIPLAARLGGVLQLADNKPLRFTDVIYYNGTSLVPVEVFIKSGLTTVGDVVATGNGRILASFYEFPSSALDAAEHILLRLRRAGLVGTIDIGEPNQPMLGLPVNEGYTGLVVSDGLNPMAAVQETGVAVENHALCRTYELGDLVPSRQLRLNGAGRSSVATG